MKEYIYITQAQEMMDQVMKKILHLGQTSVSEHQFSSFRKLAMDYFQEGKRQMEKDRCGLSKNTVKEGCYMDG